TQIAREANDALNQMTRLREQARAMPANSAALLAQVREQAQRAQALVQAGPADEVLKLKVRRAQEELDEEQKDRRMVATLEGIRLRGADEKHKAFDVTRTRRLYADAFREYGLDMEALSVVECGRRVRESAIREELLAALHDWLVDSVPREEAARR